MANVAKDSGGLVPKFVEDAAIGCFPVSGNSRLTTGRAVICGKLMPAIMREGINPALARYGHPEPRIRIGTDYSENTVITIGNGSRSPHADLISRSMNLAARMQSMISRPRSWGRGHVHPPPSGHPKIV